MKRFLLAIFLIGAQATLARADNPPIEVKVQLASAERLGGSKVRYWGFSLYFAELWATDRTPLDYEGPFALALTYDRNFTAQELSLASVKEIARIAGDNRESHAALIPMLESCFSDVAPDDRITGVSEARDRAIFFVNGRQSCHVDYPEFSPLFFGIWLGDGARDPIIRDRLLGRRQ